MALVTIASTLLKKINELIKRYNTGEINKDEINKVESSLKSLILLLEDSEANVNEMICRISNPLEAKKQSDVFYFKQNNEFSCIISPELDKPEFIEIDKITNCCNCQINTSVSFSEIKEIVIVSNISQLYLIDSQFESVIITVFCESYRSYKTQICWLSVYSENSTLYLIDAIKYRDVIPKLRLLRCGVTKLVHCKSCLKMLFSTFGDLGCYYNFSDENLHPRNIYIDYRIRPITDVFIEIISKDTNNFIALINSSPTFERFLVEIKEDIIKDKSLLLNDFLIKNNIGVIIPKLDNVLELRDYLAEEFDESPEYVMTDSQVLLFLENQPSTVKEYNDLFIRMSSIARSRATDFLLLLRKSSETFSIEKLKRSKCSNETIGEKKQFNEVVEPWLGPGENENDEASNDTISTFSISASD